MTSNPASIPITTPTFGQVGYDAYGNHAGAHGPWATFDGRPMPSWETNGAAGPGSSGALTQERWEVAARAIIEEYERRKAASSERPTRTFEKVVVVLDVASQQMEITVIGVWTTRAGPQSVTLSKETTSPGVAAGTALDAYESWKDWAPRSIVVLETATGGALFEPIMAELKNDIPETSLVMVRGCWWCGAGLECPSGCRRSPPKEQSKGPRTVLGKYSIDMDASAAEATLARLNSQASKIVSKLERADTLMTKLEEPSRSAEPSASLTMTAWTPEAGVALVNLAQARATGAPLASSIEGEGRIDPFLMGLSEISGSIRDLAEATKAVGGDGDVVLELVETTAKALNARVSALAVPPTEPVSKA